MLVKVSSYFDFTDPPEISPSFISTLTGIEGHDILLDCTAVGYPTPIVTWLFGTEELPGVLANGSILLSSLQISNEGNYTCRVTNLLGSNEATLTLTIRSEFIPLKIINII